MYRSIYLVHRFAKTETHTETPVVTQYTQYCSFCRLDSPCSQDLHIARISNSTLSHHLYCWLSYYCFSEDFSSQTSEHSHPTDPQTAQGYRRRSSLSAMLISVRCLLGVATGSSDISVIRRVLCHRKSIHKHISTKTCDPSHWTVSSIGERPQPESIQLLKKSTQVGNFKLFQIYRTNFYTQVSMRARPIRPHLYWLNTKAAGIGELPRHKRDTDTTEVDTTKFDINSEFLNWKLFRITIINKLSIWFWEQKWYELSVVDSFRIV